MPELDNYGGYSNHVSGSYFLDERVKVQEEIPEISFDAFPEKYMVEDICDMNKSKIGASVVETVCVPKKMDVSSIEEEDDEHDDEYDDDHGNNNNKEDDDDDDDKDENSP